MSHTGDQYEEAKARFDQPRAVNEAVIVEYPNMKDRSGKELQKIHDVMLQNLRALKTMGDTSPHLNGSEHIFCMEGG